MRSPTLAIIAALALGGAASTQAEETLRPSKLPTGVAAPGKPGAPVTFTRVTNACRPEERLLLGSRVPEGWSDEIGQLPQDSKAAVHAYTTGHLYFAVAQDAELKAVAEYWMWRSLWEMGVPHVAFHRFQGLYLRSTAREALGIRQAALECMNIAKEKNPNLSFNSETLAYLAKIPKRPQAGALAHLFLMEARKKVDLGQDPSDELARLNPKAPGAVFVRLLWAAANKKDAEVINLAKFYLGITAKLSHPQIKTDRDLANLMLGGALFAADDLAGASKALKAVAPSSNHFADALSLLGWVQMADGKYLEALSAAQTFDIGAMKQAFAPDSGLVASIALFETCNLPEAKQAVRLWKKGYGRTYRWLYDWASGRELASADPAAAGGAAYRPLYRELTAQLAGEGNVPARLLAEWIRSPRFVAHQAELNRVIDGRALARARATEILEMPIPEVQTPRDKFERKSRESLRQILLGFEATGSAMQAAIVEKINRDLAARSKTLLTRLADHLENIDKVEVEILNAAGDDMVEANAVGREERGGKKVEPAKDGTVLNWGRLAADKNNAKVKADDRGSLALVDDDVEIWEDELGAIRGDIIDRCPDGT